MICMFYTKSIGFIVLLKILDKEVVVITIFCLFLILNETLLNAYMIVVDMSVYGLWC